MPPHFTPKEVRSSKLGRLAPGQQRMVGRARTQTPDSSAVCTQTPFPDSCCNFRDVLSPLLANLHWAMASTTLA